MSALILKSMALYSVLECLSHKEKLLMQQLNRVFYSKIIPNSIYLVRIDNPERLAILRGKNRLVFFYPASNGCHKFSEEDELPFDRVLRVFDVGLEKVLIFPS